MDQNDAGSGGDAGNTFSIATDITFGTFICSLPEGDDNDFYKFYLSLSYQISISIAGEASANLDLHIYDATEQLLTSQTSSDSQETCCLSLSSSWYVIYVEKIVGSSAYYLVLQSTDSNTITDPTTPTDDNWEVTSRDSSTADDWFHWIIPGILVILIIVSIIAFIRARNKREYTDERRRRYEIRSEMNLGGIEDNETDSIDLVEQYSERKKLGYSFGLEDEKIDKQK